MVLGQWPSIVVCAPLAFFAGIAASAIGFAAWPLIVPILYLGFGFDIYHAILLSLLIDCGNAVVMACFGAAKKQLEIGVGLRLAMLACCFVIPGIYLGQAFIAANGDFFKGGVGAITLVIGLFFIVRGLRSREIPAEDEGETAAEKRSDRGRLGYWLIYPGVAGTALLTGLIGVGGGMNYALLLMASRGFEVRPAAATGMLITAISALFAASGIGLRQGDLGAPSPSMMLFSVFLIGMSAVGAVSGARVAYRVSEKKVNYLVGVVVILASIVVTVPQYLF